jgi:hypothetical protein
MNHRHKLPPLACTSCVELVPESLVLTPMPKWIPRLPFADRLRIYVTVRRDLTVVSGIYGSVLTTALAPVVDPSIVPYLILTAPVK